MSNNEIHGSDSLGVQNRLVNAVLLKSYIPIVAGIIERCDIFFGEMKGSTSKRQTNKKYEELTKELDNIQMN